MWSRIIDSNFNRASEAIKTLEDIVRFELEEIELANNLKTLRTNLDFYHQNNWLIERNIELEKQTEFTNQELEDLCLVDLMRLNAKKAAQSLKTIQELSQVNKIHEIACLAQDGRNQIYALEKELWLKLSNQDLKNKLQNSQIYLVTGRAENEPFESIVYKVKMALAGGVQIVQLREKGLEASQICYLAYQMKELCQKANALFIVNDRPDIALAVDADGVHVGQGDIDLNIVRRIVGRNKLIGVSVHSQEEIEIARNSEADYLSIGPIFLTPTKAGRPPIGLELIEWAAQNITEKPWFAIGGIDKENLSQVLKTGAKKFAFVKYFMEASDQTQAGMAIKNQLSEA